MPVLRRYYGFISHAWAYNEEYYRLVDMLRDATNFDFYNYSVPEHDPLTPRTSYRVERAAEWGNVILKSFGKTVADGLALTPADRPAIGGTRWPQEP